MILSSKIFFIGLLLIKFAESTCGPKFNGKCFCGTQSYENKQKYVVNCTDTKFTDTNVLENLPNEIEVLIFTGNRIEELPWNIFGSMNDYPLLTIVDMSNNHIREIRGKSYHHVQNVQRLILNHNNLSISSDGDEFNHHHPRVFSSFINLSELHLTNAFAENTSEALSENLHDIFVNSNLTKITKLHLEQNEIMKFKDRDVFCDLLSLRDLHLGDNYLKELNFNVMCLKHLRFLDLERNRFGHVKPKDLNLMNNLENLPGRSVNLIVDLSLNPFICDCNISPFIDWIDTTNVTVRQKENLKCVQSKSHQEGFILDFKTTKCKLRDGRSSTGHIVTLAILLTMFSCLLISLIGAIIYVSRERIKHMITPILDTVSKKVQYTTIKDDDCQEIHV